MWDIFVLYYIIEFLFNFEEYLMQVGTEINDTKK